MSVRQRADNSAFRTRHVLQLLTAGFGTSRTSRDVRLESASWTTADIRLRCPALKFKVGATSETGSDATSLPRTVDRPRKRTGAVQCAAQANGPRLPARSEETEPQAVGVLVRTPPTGPPGPMSRPPSRQASRPGELPGPARHVRSTRGD